MIYIVREPMIITLDEIETDDHIPSIKFLIHISANGVKYSINYEGTSWVTCKALDDFILSCKSNASELVISNINGDELLYVKELNENKYRLVFNDIKKSSDASVMSISYSLDVSQDVFENMKNYFINYPVWW